jgi:hypothetical protein
LKVFENRVLRGTFVLKKGEIIDWWKTHYEDLRNFYSSGDILVTFKTLSTVLHGKQFYIYVFSIGGAYLLFLQFISKSKQLFFHCDDSATYRVI